MNDDLQGLIDFLNIAINPTAPVNGILAANHNSVENQIITKVGRYAGFPVIASNEVPGSAIPMGGFYLNSNALNSITAFDVVLSQRTLDGNSLEFIIGVMTSGDIIKFKDFKGRAAIFVISNIVSDVDSSNFTYYTITLTGFPTNPNYIYQDTESWPAMLEFFQLRSPNTTAFTLNLGEIKKIGKGYIESDTLGIIPNTGPATLNEKGDFFCGIDEDGYFYMPMRYYGANTTENITTFDQMAYEQRVKVRIPGEPDYIDPDA